MKLGSLLSVFVTLGPVATLALDTVTVRIDTGTCAATYPTTTQHGNGTVSLDPTATAVASGVDVSKVPIAALETILPEPTSVLSSLIAAPNTPIALEPLQPTGTRSPVPAVTSPA